MNDLERAIEHCRHAASPADLPGAQVAFEQAAAVAAAATSDADRAAANLALWDLALDVAAKLDAPEPLGWATVAAGALGEPHPARALDAIRAACARYRNFGSARVDRYATDMGAFAAKQDAKSRAAPIEQRPSLRRRADAARGAVFDARVAYRRVTPGLDRCVPAAFVDLARDAVKRARAVGAHPTDEGALTGSGMPDDDVLWPLYAPRPAVGDVLARPPSLKVALVLLAVAEELAADDDEEGARWAVALGAMVPAGIRTLDPDPRESVAQVVVALADAARRFGVRGLGPQLRAIARVHDCDDDLPAAALEAMAELERAPVVR